MPRGSAEVPPPHKCPPLAACRAPVAPNWSVSASPRTPEPPNARPRLYRCRTRRRAWHWSSHGGRASRIRADSGDCRTSCARTPLPDVWVRSSAGTDECSPPVPALCSCHCEALRQGFVNNQQVPTREEGQCDFGAADQLRTPGTEEILRNHSGAASVRQHSRLAVVLLSSAGPSFPGQRTESHDHRLYHVPIAAPARFHQVLCTARGEDPRAPRAVLQARFAQLHHLSTRHWLMRQLSAVFAKSMAFGATTQGPAIGAPLRDKHCGDGSHTARQRRPERVHGKQDTFLRHHAVQRKANARRARANTYRYASLVFRSDSSEPATNTSERYCPVSQPWSHTLATSHSSTTGPHKAATLTKSSLPTREGLIHLFFRTNKSVSEILRLNDACPSGATSAHTLPSRKRRATLGVDGPIGIAVVVPILVLFSRVSPQHSVDSFDFQCCGFGLLPLRNGASGKRVLVGALHTARSSSMGSQASHPSYCTVHGTKEVELQSAAPNQ